MAATDIPLPDDAQDSCTSQSDATWNPHDQGSRGYGGPAARESSRCQTSRLVLLDYRSPVTHGFELDDRLQSAGGAYMATVSRHEWPWTLAHASPS